MLQEMPMPHENVVKKKKKTSLFWGDQPPQSFSLVSPWGSRKAPAPSPKVYSLLEVWDLGPGCIAKGCIFDPHLLTFLPVEQGRSNTTEVLSALGLRGGGFWSTALRSNISGALGWSMHFPHGIRGGPRSSLKP